jgi:hypothetical protein
MPYNGSPWRSRFLRSPKIGLELASRGDFVALGDVATIKLGMKTGADEYFFLNATGTPSGTRIPVKGLKNWEGQLHRSDLIPAIQSPKDLDTSEGRRAEIPSRRGRYAGEGYYFAPRPRLGAAAREYVAWGELQGVHERSLVRANSDATGWYRQTRAQVTSRWILPYNSGYDYGAVENSIGALLNGRLVGVDPNAGVDVELLGAVLNSTAVTMMRLLEGVTTGNEGAFDVGPPAARVMRIPDPRKMTEPGRGDAVTALDAIRASGYLPPAPDRHGSVVPLRRDLDVAIFAALGLSRGEATVLADRVYASYGRWRAAVEDVEDQMQIHRRALTRRGGTRSETPLQRATRTVWDEIHPTATLLLDELMDSVDFDLVDPLFRTTDDGQGALFAGNEFPTADGGVIDLGDPRRVDLARRVRDLGYTGPVPLPRDPAAAQRVRDHMLVLEATMRSEIERRASTYVSADLVAEVTEQVIRRWVSTSIAGFRERLSETTSVNVNGPDLFITEGLVPPYQPDA